MTLNGVIVLILHYFTELIALQANYVTVVEYRPIMSAKCHLPSTCGQNLPMQQSHSLFVTAKLLVLHKNHIIQCCACYQKIGGPVIMEQRVLAIRPVFRLQ